MKVKLSILLILLICSCTPQKRLNRLVKNHPELMRVDTVLDIDTFITKEIKLDTFFKYEDLLLRDTITIVKDKTTVKYFKGDSDTIFTDIFVEADTIIQTEIITHDVIEVKKYIPRWIWAVIVCLVILFVIKLIKSK